MGSIHGKPALQPKPKSTTETSKMTKEGDLLPNDSSVNSRRLIQEGLVRERDKKSEVADYYEILDEIGAGGICKVYRIKKRNNKIGGSSRSDNVKHKRKFSFSTLIPPSPGRSSLMRYMSSGSKTNSDDEFSTVSSLTTLSTTPTKMISRLNSEPPVRQRVDPYVSDGDFATQKQQSSMFFALKEINLTMVASDKVDQLRNEVDILKALDHTNIIKAYETFQANKKIVIVMELCTGGDLHSRIPYAESQAARIARQILSAVSYMHSKSIVHRDLKLENIIFESKHDDSIVKVIDFGLSKAYSATNNILSERVGTLYSMSPETLLGDYTSQADLWSIGVCCYMLLARGEQPFEGKTPKQIVAKILVGKYNFKGEAWAEVSNEAKQFIGGLLVIKPDDRLNAESAKHHLWLKESTRSRSEMKPVVNHEFKNKVRECIVRYANNGDFMKLALNVIAKKSSSEDIFALRAIFDEFDTKNTGVLDLSEFKAALNQSNYSEGDIEDMFRKIDINKNNVINYTEFLAAAIETQGGIEEYRLAEAFDLMDSDDSGYISKKNLKQILGDNADSKYLDQLIAEADFKNDGKISYNEFLQAFNRKSKEMVSSMYDNSTLDDSVDGDDMADEVLRRHGMLGGIRRALNSSGSLKNTARGHARSKTR